MVGARILAAIVLVTACGPQPIAPVETASLGNVAAHRVMIAVLAPTRGEHANTSNAVRAGVAIGLAAARDADSGVAGVQSIEILQSDAGDGSVDESRTAAHILVGRTDVIAIVMALPHDASEAAVSELSAGTAIVITTNGYAWTGGVDVTARPELEAATAGRFVGQVLRARKPATLGASVDVHHQLASAFARSVKRFTAEPIAQTFPITARGGTDPLGELAKQGVDAVYTTLPERQSHALSTAAVHGLRVPFVVAGEWGDAALRDVARTSGARIYMLVPLDLDDGEPITKEFVERHRQKRGGRPSIEAAMGYDAARLAYAALDAAENPLDPASVRTAIATVYDVPSLSGPLALDRSGNALRPMFVRDVGKDLITARVAP